MSETIKLRILRREDGTVFTYSETLARRRDMRAGWMHVEEDGKRRIEVDKPVTKEIDPTTVFEQNQALQNQLYAAEKEIEALKKRLGEKSVDPSRKVASGVTLVSELPVLGGGEVEDLTFIVPEPEPAEPPKVSKRK